jgi:hypothetical protein
VSVGNPVLASVSFGGPFVAVDGVCFHFTFQNDLLDPGDWLSWHFDSADGGFGFINLGTDSQPARTGCIYVAFGHEAYTSLFLDGGHTIEISVDVGSVELAGLRVVVIGTRSLSAQLVDLIRAVKGVGPGASLANKLRRALTHWENSDLTGSCSAIAAFINQVHAQSGKHIPTETAKTLIVSATRLEATLGCTNEP